MSPSYLVLPPTSSVGPEGRVTRRGSVGVHATSGQESFVDLLSVVSIKSYIMFLYFSIQLLRKGGISFLSYYSFVVCLFYFEVCTPVGLSTVLRCDKVLLKGILILYYVLVNLNTNDRECVCGHLYLR